MPTRRVVPFTPWRRIPTREPTWSPSLSLVHPAGSNHRAAACLVDQPPRPFAWLRHRGRVRQGEGSKDHPAPLSLLHLVRSTPTAHPFHLQLLSFTRRRGSGVAAAPAAVTRSSLLRPDRHVRYLVRGTRLLHTSRAQPGHLQPPAGRSPSRQAPRPAIRASAGRRSTSTSSTASQPNTRRALSGTDHRHTPVSTASRGLLSPAPGAQRLSHRPEAQSETDRQAACPARTAECTSTGVTGGPTPSTAQHERSTSHQPRRRAPHQAPAPSRGSHLGCCCSARSSVPDRSASPGDALASVSELDAAAGPQSGTDLPANADGDIRLKATSSPPHLGASRLLRSPTRRHQASIRPRRAHNRQSTGSHSQHQTLQPGAAPQAHSRKPTAHSQCVSRHQKREGAARPRRGLRPPHPRRRRSAQERVGASRPGHAAGRQSPQAPLPRRSTSRRGFTSMRALRAPAPQPGGHPA